MIQWLLDEGSLPGDVIMDGGIRLLVKGKSDGARLSGLQLLENVWTKFYALFVSAKILWPSGTGRLDVGQMGVSNSQW